MKCSSNSSSLSREHGNDTGYNCSRGVHQLRWGFRPIKVSSNSDSMAFSDPSGDQYAKTNKPKRLYHCRTIIWIPVVSDEVDEHGEDPGGESETVFWWGSGVEH
ncbi:hypothetical protein TWF506_005944 [Arthrobotrys conoides]|uniref:Uncharacterized protein n=1 Tax=Arthrobotrys conoides TaxID=74498 RepID=A0AAN8NF09_9PEZI